MPVNKPSIFISCGQFTADEKKLGNQIARMVRELTGLEPFFAEQVQDLNGLDDNILNALHNCVALITVMHPRGMIRRPDNSVLIRASVWIEQEIAIATYIKRIEKRDLPIIAFKHSSVGREGIRDLLHLNPIEFTEDSEVLAALPERLRPWKSLAPVGIRVELDSVRVDTQDGHPIRKLQVTLVNDTNQRITSYDAEVRIPAGILKHWSAVYPHEVRSDDPSRRRFRFSQQGRSIPGPHDKAIVYGDNYCAVCAVKESGTLAPVSLRDTVEVKVWIDEREYSANKTIEELAQDEQ